jgi:ACS family tartrate transporter-like MFS transporter
MTGSASEIERRTIRKVAWRLLPLIVVIYFVAYIDRTNVSFAAFGMTRDLGLTAYIFGWGAGIFFVGYFIAEVPSNLLLEKFGARLWIARIMITWGLMAAAMAFVQGTWSFLILRFLLARISHRTDCFAKRRDVFRRLSAGRAGGRRRRRCR